MDDTTKNMLTSLAAGAVKKLLVAGGTAAAAHGYTTTGISPEFYAGAAVALVTASIGFWNDYGKSILVSQLEVLKAKSLAQAAKMRDAGVSPVTNADIADQSPTMTTKTVDKVVATLPPAVQSTVEPTK